MKTSAVITNIQKFSVHDGPGIRSIVFFKGCPLACQWCANPENINFNPELMCYESKCIACASCVKACPENAINAHLAFNREKCVNCGTCAKVCGSQARILKGKTFSNEEIREKVDKDYAFYKNSGGGITFSGGEPLLHPQFILDIAKNYRDRGLNSAIETCGYVPWKNFQMVEPWIDLFLYDLKFIDAQKHERYCKKGNKLILDNLRRLCKNSQVVVRMPIIPGINDTESDLDLAGAFLSEIKSEISGIHCLPYHNLGASKYDALGIEYKLSDVEMPKNEHMETVKRKLEQYDLDVQIGG